MNFKISLKTKIKTLFVLLLFSFSFFPLKVIKADEQSDMDKLNDEIGRLSEQLKEAQNKIGSLKGELQYMDSQIQLTVLRMSQTASQIDILELQIEDLSKKINILNVSLDQVSALFINRVVETYKAGKFSSLDLLFSSNGFADFFRRARYLEAAQTNDRQVLLTMEEIRFDYDSQKKEKEEKQEELERLKNQLAGQKLKLDEQKKTKEHLLIITRNDEKKYQQLLAQARAEYQALQAILAGKGDETEVGGVTAGERIANVIEGGSCNSSGTHLHFTIADGGNPLNPFNYLKSVGHENCSGPGECSSADAFNPSGSWDWPLNPTIRLTQGYGSTWAVANTWVGRIYSFHNGIDITGSSSEVKAIQDGILYRGSYTGGGGCRLPYVRIEHKDSNISTYYLHINYEKV